MSEIEKKPLGKILLEQKIVSRKDLQDYLGRQKESGERLGSLIDREMPESHGSILRALSIQHGVPAIDLDEVVIALPILRLVPREVAAKNRILPIVEKEEHLFIAMTDPANQRVVDEIEFVSAKKIFKYVAIDRQLAAAIEECYKLHEEGKPYFRGAKVSDEKYARVVSAHEQKAAAAGGGGPSPEDDFPAPGREAEDDGSITLFSLGKTDAVRKAPPRDEPRFLDEERAGGARSPAKAAALEAAPAAAPHKLASIPPEDLHIDVESPTPEVTILVVDDEQDILNLIGRVLSDHHYRVITAANGRDALALLKTHTPSLIILDAMLPEIHGFEICKRLKGSARYGAIPVIMISAIYRGWRFAKDLKESYGVDVFMEKPFNINELVKTVEKALRRPSAPPPKPPVELSEESVQCMEASAKAYRAGDMKGAIQHLKSAILIDPLSPKLHYNLALLYGKVGLVYYAISELESVLEIEPAMFPAMKNLAILYQEAGFKNKAIEIWERALSMSEDEDSRKKIREHLLTLL